MTEKIKKASVYTKTGDKGETSLVSGNRLSKANAKIDLYGEVDELNSHVGVGICQIETLSSSNVENFKVELELLYKIQHVLFDLGSNLACEDEFRLKYKLPQISDSIIKELESHMDQMDSQLEKLKNFVLPGGSLISAQFHVCRTVTRRVERKLVASQSLEELPVNSIQLINRLSDYFFILSRYANTMLKTKEIVWKIGAY